MTRRPKSFSVVARRQPVFRGGVDRPPSDRFHRRYGDLVVTHRDLGMWFGDVEPDELSLVGTHGGISPAEMLVPFGAARLSALA